jgi:hypothetical protein
MKSLSQYRVTFLVMGCFAIIPSAFAQQPTLTPNAADIYGNAQAGTIFVGNYGPIIPTHGADVQGFALPFYLKGDVDKHKAIISAARARGMKYTMNLDLSVPEINPSAIVADNQGITDENFGVVLDFDGNKVKGLGGEWMRSINRPAWRNFIIDCIKRGIDAGVDESGHDGGAMLFSYSFDPDDLEAFKTWIQQNSISPGDWDINTETYNSYLKRKGKTIADIPGDDQFGEWYQRVLALPLYDKWLYFKTEQIKKSMKIIVDTVKAYAVSTKNKNFNVFTNMGGNAFGGWSGFCYFSGIQSFGEYFDFGSRYPLTGTTTPRHRLIQSLGLRNNIWSMPTFDASGSAYWNTQSQIEQNYHTIAEAFASGGLTGMGYPSSLTYVPFLLVQKQRKLLNSVSPKGEIGIIFSWANSLITTVQHNYGAQLLLQDMGMSYENILVKPNLGGAADDLTLSQISKYKVLLLPNSKYLTNNCITVLLNYVNQGGILLVMGDETGKYDEYRAPRSNATWSSLVEQPHSTITTYGSGKIAVVVPEITGNNYWSYRNSTVLSEVQSAAHTLDTLKHYVDLFANRDIIRTTLSQLVQVFRYQDTVGHAMVYQFANGDVDGTSLLHNTQISKTVKLAVPPSIATDSVTLTYYSMEQSDGISLGTSGIGNGMVTVTLPSLHIWGFIKIGPKSTPLTLAIGSLTINGSQQPWKLKSKSDISVNWQATKGTQEKYQIQVWENASEIGSPFLNNAGTLRNEQHTLELKKHKLVFHSIVNSFTSSHFFSGNSFRDSLGYLVQVRIIQGNDTSSWNSITFYRNGVPIAPKDPQIYIARQKLWYYGVAGIDSSRFPIIRWVKGASMQDFELDTLTYGVNIFTDSLINNSDSTKPTYSIASQFTVRKPSVGAGDSWTDTLKTSLAAYENYGIWFKVFATDGVDTSLGSTWARYILDNFNEPPRPFNLLSPINLSA